MGFEFNYVPDSAFYMFVEVPKPHHPSLYLCQNRALKKRKKKNQINDHHGVC